MTRGYADASKFWEPDRATSSSLCTHERPTVSRATSRAVSKALRRAASRAFCKQSSLGAISVPLWIDQIVSRSLAVRIERLAVAPNTSQR